MSTQDYTIVTLVDSNNESNAIAQQQASRCKAVHLYLSPHLGLLLSDASIPCTGSSEVIPKKL